MLTTIALVTLFNLGGFLIGGALLHRHYHVRRRAQAAEWKHQPKKFQKREQILEKLPLVLLNGTIINIAIGMTLHLAISGETSGFWMIDPNNLGSSAAMAVMTPILCGFWYHVSLYYVHRTLHHPKLYRHVHHLHHRYKTPMYLDALYEHPLEAMYGGFVISAPLLFAPIWIPGWLIFVAVVGLHEVLDHSGVNLNIPLLSRSWDHDEHHRRFHNGYGQLLSMLDAWHGTTPVPQTPRATAARSASTATTKNTAKNTATESATV